METNKWDFLPEKYAELKGKYKKLIEKRDVMVFQKGECDEEINSLCKELGSLRQKKAALLNSKKMKVRKYLTFQSVASYIATILVAGIVIMVLPIFHPQAVEVVKWTLLAFVSTASWLTISVLVGEYAKNSLEEINGKMSELEESLQLQENNRKTVVVGLKAIHQALAEVNQSIVLEMIFEELRTGQYNRGEAYVIELEDKLIENIKLVRKKGGEM